MKDSEDDSKQKEKIFSEILQAENIG